MPAETQTNNIKSFADLATRVSQGHRLNSDEALEILSSDDASTLLLVSEAGRLRRKYFGNSVKVNYLVNLKSGLCPEDCTYCSQRLGSKAEILKYTWLKTDEAVHQAELGIAGGASRVCLVASGKSPSNRDVDRVADLIGALKDEHPDVEVCACLGILKDGQADQLRSAGADAYNHNLNTAESMYPDICSTHSFDERVQTVQQAQASGLSPCSGLIVGMGETNEQLVEAVFALRELNADSIPINFLMPFDGTPLEGTWNLTPLACLRILALVRMACPDKEVRIAGGREMHLRSMQATALEVANSLFLGDYLTSEGQDSKADLQMIADAGFEVLGQDHSDTSAQQTEGKTKDCSDSAACGGQCCTTSSTHAEPALRRRGAGTQQLPNA